MIGVPAAQSYRSNAGAQLLKGLVQLLQGAALPLVVAQFVPAAQFRAWALAWGVALLAGYLDFGLQTGIAGLTARLLAAGRPAAARRHAQAALLVAGIVGALALAAACLVSWLVASVFPGLEPGLRHEVQICVPVLVAAQLLNVQAGVVFGYFTGAQRTASAARLLTSWRLATLGAIVAGGLLGSGVIGLSVVLLGGNALGAVAMTYRLQQEHRPERDPAGSMRPEPLPLLRVGVEVVRSTGALAFWSVAMLCITGLDLIVVGRVDYAAVGAYAIAASLTVGITGVGNALQTPMMPRLASIGDRDRMLGALRWMTRLNSVGVVALTAAVMLAAGTPLITALAPHTHRGSTAEFTVVLAAAVGLRLIGGPLALALIASGASNRVYIPQLLEAVVNVAASITLGVLYGAVGVAYGTLTGAVVGVLGLLSGSVPRWFGRPALRPIAGALIWEPLRYVGPLLAVVAARLCGAPWSISAPLLLTAVLWLLASGRALAGDRAGDAPDLAAPADAIPSQSPSPSPFRSPSPSPSHDPRVASEGMS